MRWLLMALTGVALGTCLLQSEAQAAENVCIGFTGQIHTANMMVLQEHAKKNGVELDVAVMRGYPSIQLALVTDQLDLAVLGFVNVGLMEEQRFSNYKVIAGVFSGAQNLTLRTGVTANAWKDLEGKKIRTAPNTYTDMLLHTSARPDG